MTCKTCKINSKNMGILGTFPLNNQKPTPKFYMLNIATTDSRAMEHIFNFACVAMSEQEAFRRALNTMKEVIPQLWEIGQSGSGFEIMSSEALSENQITKAFNAYKTENFSLPVPKQEITIKFVPITEKPQDSKNQLIKQIIETRDRALLEANRGNLTDYEISYIEDTIK